MLLHATCISIDKRGILLAGAPGVGKSDLALRLIDSGAQLVADDQTELRSENSTLIASPPPAIAGMIEMRHIGLMRMPFIAHVPVALYVELTNLDEKPERLPEPDRVFLLDHRVQRLRLPGLAGSTPAKIRLFLKTRMAQ